MAKTIRHSIAINARKEKVWDVLFQDKYTCIWFSQFSEGAHAETDWSIGNEAVFIDDSKHAAPGSGRHLGRKTAVSQTVRFGLPAGNGPALTPLPLAARLESATGRKSSRPRPHCSPRLSSRRTP